MTEKNRGTNGWPRTEKKPGSMNIVECGLVGGGLAIAIAAFVFGLAEEVSTVLAVGKAFLYNLISYL